MDYMIANIPSAEAYCAGENFSEVANVMTPDVIERLQNRITGGFTLIKPHTGMQFSIGNVHFETITTWEDLSPVMCSNTNDTNTVFRLTITSNNSDEKTTLMWLGDTNRLQSRFMCATFGTYLKSDMSTIAHHGNAGCEIDLYEMIDPETYFWMHHAGAVQSYLNPENKGWINQVDQYIAYEQESVKRIFANGAQNVLSEVSKGELPATNGFFHISFENGVADFDHVKELHFSWEKVDGKWVAVGRADVSDLQHTNISKGAAGFHTNPAGTMTFCSSYMVKCVQGCPTGYHVN
jgi:hypothetical protein